MKPLWAAQEVYSHFDAFIEKSILSDESYITDHPGIFSIANLDSCEKAFVVSPDYGDRTFIEKSRDQFAGYSTEVKIVFANFIWLWGMPASDMTVRGKRRAIDEFIGAESVAQIQLRDVVVVHGGIGSSGQRHKLKKPNEISFLLLLFRDVKNKVKQGALVDLAAVKEHVKQLCLDLYYRNEETTLTSDNALREVSKAYLAMHHILLHLCDPDQFQAIAAQKHKDAILNTFFTLLNKDDTNGLWDDIDGNILAIRRELSRIQEREVNFYDADIRIAWDFEEAKDDISEESLLEYKKAMVFYGPPGTSKTYSADRLAKLLISKHYFRNKQRISDYFRNAENLFKSNIHRLQLHSNYNYEDFVVGIHVEDKGTVVKPGYLLNLIEKIKGDPLPHILILDEINRVDISRLFGEVFSAMEYRNNPIKLSVGELEINVPENLYFIGTMNEIDFSLERIDFALRRRFLWREKGFDQYLLFDMIKAKKEDKKNNRLKIEDTDIETFVERCAQLNDKISTIRELGKNYQVGHAFFAEVVDVFRMQKETRAGRLYFLKHAPPILWEVSIKPILEAFMGNMDSDMKEQRINDLRNTFTKD